MSFFVKLQWRLKGFNISATLLQGMISSRKHFHVSLEAACFLKHWHPSVSGAHALYNVSRSRF
jgi:hypothetical protein